MYSNGWGVSRNYKEAVKWFKLAAEQDSPKAINHMGVLYDNGGFGLTADHKKAVFHTDKPQSWVMLMRSTI